MQTVEVLGVRVACLTLSQMLSLVVEWTHSSQLRSVAYANAHSLNLASRTPDFKALLRQTDLVYADGISVVWAARFLYGARLQKMTGRAWIEDFCAVAEQHALRLYLLAGQPGVAEAAAQRLRQRWPALKIVGCADGFFAQKSASQVLEEIQLAHPHLLFLGMGSPQQEAWVAQHRQQISAPVCWSVGALFDYLAGREAPVPNWLDRLGLEWLWRLGLDPRRKWQRYVLGNPLFIMRVIKQKIDQGK